MAVTFLKTRSSAAILTQNEENGDVFLLKSITFQVHKFLNVMASKL